MVQVKLGFQLGWFKKGVLAPLFRQWFKVVQVVEGGGDVMFSRTFIGGHFEKGGEQDNSEPARLLADKQIPQGQIDKPKCYYPRFLHQTRRKI